MINYSKKFKGIDDIAKQYKPMRYRIMGIEREEHLPRFVLLRPLASLMRQTKVAIGME